MANPIVESSLRTPVQSPPAADVAEAADAAPRDGVALCLSGGGYRAMVFHLGSLWRLNEAGAMPKIARISSVSGGSITAGALATAWASLAFDGSNHATNFDTAVVAPVRRLASRTIDVWAVLRGLLLPGDIAGWVAHAYDKHLFNGMTLAGLPSDENGPRFVFNATSVMTGALWRFSRPYMGDWRVGLVYEPDCRLAVAVAASSAFPPVLSPLTLRLDPAKVIKTDGADLHKSPYTSKAVLTDGGVYDNLGLETAFKAYRTLLVSDAGQKMAPESNPAKNWIGHAIRVNGLIDNQVRSLRKRQLIASYESAGDEGRDGTYWSTRSTFDDYARGATLSDPLGLAGFDPTPLAGVPTRLKRLDGTTQERLINWGYAICDTALRRHAREAMQNVGVEIRDPKGLPYPAAGL